MKKICKICIKTIFSDWLQMDLDEDEAEDSLLKVFEPHILGIFYFKMKKTKEGYKYKPYLFAHSYKDIIMLEEPFVTHVTTELNHVYLNELLRIQVCKESEIFEEARNLGFLCKPVKKIKEKIKNEGPSVSMEE
jgi:hypothetical protein